MNRLCKVDNCNNPVKYKGLCNRHYLQMKRHKCIVNTTNDYSKINILENHAEIIITDKYNKYICTAIIDIDDVDKCSNFNWKLSAQGYIHSYKNNNNIFLHNVIYKKRRYNTVIDHINRNKLDNRKINLREVEYTINSHNRDNIKNPKGIYFSNKDKKWVVSFYYKGKRFYFGKYEDKEEAINVAKENMKTYNII